MMSAKRPKNLVSIKKTVYYQVFLFACKWNWSKQRMSFFHRFLCPFSSIKYLQCSCRLSVRKSSKHNQFSIHNLHYRAYSWWEWVAGGGRPLLFQTYRLFGLIEFIVWYISGFQHWFVKIQGLWRYKVCEDTRYKLN